MNQRIRELTSKALDKAVPYTWHNLDHVEMEKVMKEFAELIVRECADICYNREYTDGSAYGQAIEKQFGVEYSWFDK